MVANSDGDGVFDREFFRGRLDARSTPRTLLYWNQEFRSTIWDHMTFANLGQLVEPIFARRNLSGCFFFSFFLRKIVCVGRVS